MTFKTTTVNVRDLKLNDRFLCCSSSFGNELTATVIGIVGDEEKLQVVAGCNEYINGCWHRITVDERQQWALAKDFKYIACIGNMRLQKIEPESQLPKLKDAKIGDRVIVIDGVVGTVVRKYHGIMTIDYGATKPRNVDSFDVMDKDGKHWEAEYSINEAYTPASPDSINEPSIKVEDNKSVSVGDYQTASVGYNGNATAGNDGTAMAGYYGTATAGYRGTATAGEGGTATAGNCGTATAGYRGTATAGDYGTATAGYYGTATAGGGGTATTGDYGTATAGEGGTATAGNYGCISIKYYDGIRYRIVSGNIGEDGLEPNVKYKLDSNHKFIRVEQREVKTDPKKIPELVVPNEEPPLEPETVPLGKCDLGDKIEFYLDEDVYVANTKTVLQGTIYAKSAFGCFISTDNFLGERGFRRNEMVHNYAFTYLSNEKDFKFGVFLNNKANVRVIERASKVEEALDANTNKAVLASGTVIKPDTTIAISKMVGGSGGQTIINDHQTSIAFLKDEMKALRLEMETLKKDAEAKKFVIRELATKQGEMRQELRKQPAPARTATRSQDVIQYQPGDRVEYRGVGATVVGLFSTQTDAGNQYVLLGYDEKSGAEAGFCGRGYFTFIGETITCLTNIHTYDRYKTLQSEDLKLISYAPENTSVETVAHGHPLARKRDGSLPITPTTDPLVEVEIEVEQSTSKEASQAAPANAEQPTEEKAASLSPWLMVAGAAVGGLFTAMTDKTAGVRVATEPEMFDIDATEDTTEIAETVNAT